MHITMTDEFRKKLISVLSFIKMALAVFGLVYIGLVACSIDSITTGFLRILLTIVVTICSAMVIEVLTVKFLVKDGETVRTIFSFDCYGDKSEEF